MTDQAKPATCTIASPIIWAAALSPAWLTGLVLVAAQAALTRASISGGKNLDIITELVLLSGNALALASCVSFAGLTRSLKLAPGPVVLSRASALAGVVGSLVWVAGRSGPNSEHLLPFFVFGPTLAIVFAVAAATAWRFSNWPVIAALTPFALAGAILVLQLRTLSFPEEFRYVIGPSVIVTFAFVFWLIAITCAPLPRQNPPPP